MEEHKVFILLESLPVLAALGWVCCRLAVEDWPFCLACRYSWLIACVVQLSWACCFSRLLRLGACFLVPWKPVCRRVLTGLGFDSYGSLRGHVGSRVEKNSIRVSFH